ncbi:MAG: TAXI family TRAP transporter solute-binding subunit, partial [Verrucomicrobiia bacterium]
MSKHPSDSLPFLLHRRPGLWVWLLLSGLVIGVFLFTWQFVDPPPPKEIVIATGESGGRYKALGQQLQSALRERDLKIKIRETAGSVENLELLKDPSSGVALGLVQSGLAKEKDYPSLRALGSLFYEPLWVFVRRDAGVESFTDLGGKRIAVGAPGSGSPPVA